MQQIKHFVVLIAIVLLPLCSSFSWGNVQPQITPSFGSRSGYSNTIIDTQTTPHSHDAVLDDLTGYIQIKASTKKSSKSTTFDLSKLQTYLKDVDHQLLALQSQVASLQQAKQTLDIIKNAFGGSSGGNCGSLPPRPNFPLPPTMTCPKCPSCSCPPSLPCPPARPCPSSTQRPSRYPTATSRTTTTKAPVHEFEFETPDTSEQTEDGWSDEW